MKNTPLLFYCGSGGSSQFDWIAQRAGWGLGIRSCGKYKPGELKIDFVDLDWKNYNHNFHLEMCRKLRPHLASARDIESLDDLPEILKEAEEISRFAEKVVLIPKIPVHLPPLNFDWIWGYSIPTSYGGSSVPLDFFLGKDTHLLGGSVHKQAEIYLNSELKIYSLDAKDFALCAKFGKSTWPGASPKYQKIGSGCYEAFTVSVTKTSNFYFQQ